MQIAIVLALFTYVEQKKKTTMMTKRNNRPPSKDVRLILFA